MAQRKKIDVFLLSKQCSFFSWRVPFLKHICFSFLVFISTQKDHYASQFKVDFLVKIKINLGLKITKLPLQEIDKIYVLFEFFFSNFFVKSNFFFQKFILEFYDIYPSCDNLEPVSRVYSKTQLGVFSNLSKFFWVFFT